MKGQFCRGKRYLHGKWFAKTSTILLQRNPSFAETPDQVHFSCRRLCRKSTKYGCTCVVFLTASVYELSERPSYYRCSSPRDLRCRCRADAMKADQHVDDSKRRHRHHSPAAASVSSSQQDVRTGSSMSTSGSSEPTDVASPVIHNSAALPPPPPPTMTDNAQVRSIS